MGGCIRDLAGPAEPEALFSSEVILLPKEWNRDGHHWKVANCLVFWFTVLRRYQEAMMAGQKGFWDFEERLAQLSAEGDPLVKLSATLDFEVFRPILLRALRQSGPSRMGGPPFCPALQFRVLVLQSLHGLLMDR